MYYYIRDFQDMSGLGPPGDNKVSMKMACLSSACECIYEFEPRFLCEQSGYKPPNRPKPFSITLCLQSRLLCIAPWLTLQQVVSTVLTKETLFPLDRGPLKNLACVINLSPTATCCTHPRWTLLQLE